MRSDLFANVVSDTPAEPFGLQNPKMLRVRLNGQMSAKQGAMVAYRGNVDFAYKGQGGLSGFAKKALTGEGQNLMAVTGKGDVYFADFGHELFILHLENDVLVVNGRNLIAFEAGVQYTVTRTKGGVGAVFGGGFFSTTLTGTGGVCLASLGAPILIPTDGDVFVDRDALLAWSGNVQTSIRSTFKVAGLIGRGSGELAQMQLSGAGGFVLVQAGEPAVAVTPGAG